MDLAEFLLARIAEDEAVARAAATYYDEEFPAWTLTDDRHIETYRSWPDGEPRPMQVGSLEVHPIIRSDDSPGGYLVHEEAMPHIARHDPARVLAECESKRAVIAELMRLHVRAGVAEVGPNDDPIFRVLALPYADHESYREEWKP